MLFAILDATAVVISVTASDNDLSDATHVKLPDMTPVEAVLGKTWDGNVFAFAPGAGTIPDGPTLGDWRVGLTLWGRMDDVTSKVAALVSASDPSQAIVGKIAKERLEYSNNVLRAQLLQLKDAVGFTAADVDESLWRAHQVSLGDLSGKWPLS